MNTYVVLLWRVLSPVQIIILVVDVIAVLIDKFVEMEYVLIFLEHNHCILSQLIKKDSYF